MSYSIDANILLHASDSSNPWHAPAAEFLARCAARSEILCLAWPTVMAYLRISTHPSIFAEPLTQAEAERNVHGLLALPQVRLLSAGEDFWKSYRQVTSKLPVRGNLVPDAHVAALLLHHGLRTIYTRDRDFQKFDFLDARDPFA